MDNHIKNGLIIGYTTITFIFFTNEKNNDGNIRLRYLLGIRNFIDYSYCLERSLLGFFKSHFDPNYLMYGEVVKVNCLPLFKDIKNLFVYMFEVVSTKKLYSKMYVTASFYKGLFQNLYNIICFYLGWGCEVVEINNKKENGFLNTISGVRLRNNVVDQTTLINLLQYFLVLKNFYIHGGNIYEKITDTLISYRLVGTIKNILYDGFKENVVDYFSVKFYNYFYCFDFNYLLASYLIDSIKIIGSIGDISTNKIDLDPHIMEFTDGVYLVEYNILILICNVGTLNNKTTTRYYDKPYPNGIKLP